MRSALQAFSRLPWRSGAATPGSFSGRKAPVIRSSLRFLRHFSSGREDLAGLCDALDARCDQCVDVLGDWIARGNALTPESLSSVFDHLTGRGHYKEALKILSSARENKVVELSVKNCISEITLLCRQHAPVLAEVVFLSIPPALRTDELIAAFVISLAKQKSLSKAEAYKLQLSALSAEVEDAMIALYFSRDSHDRVCASYERLRYSGIKPLVRTYLILLKCKERIGGLEGLESEALEALASVDSTTAQEMVLAHMMEIYGYLRDPAGVEKTWNLIKQRSPLPLYDSYDAAIIAYGLAGQVQKAESVMEEAITGNKVRQGSNPYHRLIDVYARNGLLDKAEDTMRTKTDNTVFYPFNSLILGHLARNDTTRALELLDEGSQKRNADSSLSYMTVMKLLGVFAARKDVKSAEKVARLYRNRGDFTVYDAIIKVYAAADCAPNLQLLDKLKIRPFKYGVP